MFEPRSSFHTPAECMPTTAASSSAEPSVIAASTTWPLPDFCASSRPATTPRASSMPPPPKSPTRLSGGTGLPPLLPIEWSTPESAM